MSRDWTRYGKIFKVVCGGILITTFFLPVASCERKPPASAQNEILSQQVDQRDSGTAPKITEFYYPYKSFKADNPHSWMELLGFAWPLPIVLLQLLFRGSKRKWLLSVGGLGLSLWSAYVFFGITIFRDLTTAGWLGSVAVGCLFLTYLSEVATFIWKKIRSRGGHFINSFYF